MNQLHGALHQLLWSLHQFNNKEHCVNHTDTIFCGNNTELRDEYENILENKYRMYKQNMNFLWIDRQIQVTGTIAQWQNLSWEINASFMENVKSQYQERNSNHQHLLKVEINSTKKQCLSTVIIV